MDKEDEEKTLREVRALAVLKSKYIVRYNSVWIVNDDYG